MKTLLTRAASLCLLAGSLLMAVPLIAISCTRPCASADCYTCDPCAVASCIKGNLGNKYHCCKWLYSGDSGEPIGGCYNDPGQHWYTGCCIYEIDTYTCYDVPNPPQNCPYNNQAVEIVVATSWNRGENCYRCNANDTVTTGADGVELRVSIPETNVWVTCGTSSPDCTDDP